MNVSEKPRDDEVSRIYIALPRSLESHIREMAAKEHRTLTGQVVLLLERGMESAVGGVQS